MVIENRRAPIVTQMVWYKAGAADEVQGVSGIAHFLEHLMFKGTTNLAPGEFNRIVARYGGRDNAFTGHDYTAYFQSVSRDRLDAMMRIEADRMANLTLAEREVLSERDVVLEERRQVVDQRPSSRMREQMAAALFANHPYGRPIIGWEHEIARLSRQDALDWYARWYAPNNAMLIVSGDVSADEVRALAERHYGPIARKPVPERVRAQEPPAVAARRVELRDPRVRQPSWSRAWLAPSHNRALPGVLGAEMADALDLAAEIVGGGPTSPLARALVHDRPLASGVAAAYDSANLDLSTFWVFASPREGTDLRALEAAIEETLARILREGVSEDDVARAKRRTLDQAVFARDGIGTAPRAFGTAFATGKDVAWVETWPQRVAALTAEQVNAALRAVLGQDGHVTGNLLPRPGT
ncbi:MAG: insulinase family protein [Tagaea sp.]|nr:insulinase family protein [Tagaea sp.]